MLSAKINRGFLLKLWQMKKHESAFTIVELLVVVGLVAVFSSTLFALFRGANQSQARATDDLQMQSRVLSSQNEILRIIRDGKSFILPRLGEEACVLAFIDKVGDIQVIYPRKDAALSKKTGRELYALNLYRVDIKDFDLLNPIKKGDGRKICEFVEDIKFRLSNANSVNVSVSFATEKRQFQIVFEGGLMNSSDF